VKIQGVEILTLIGGLYCIVLALKIVLLLLLVFENKKLLSVLDPPE
jgi:hypothetical protein